MHILFIGKKDDEYCVNSSEYLRRQIDSADVVFLSKGDKLPDNIATDSVDYIISYLSPLVIPQILLQKAKIAAINFHPGTPDYPGIGCTNFALYNEEEEYGITCHQMEETVDTGQIIAVRRFSIQKTDSVFSVTQRCHEEISVLFRQIIDLIVSGQELPVSNEHWTREPYTRNQLNELGRITDDMSDDEVKKRVQAMTYPDMPGAFIEKAGFRFYV